jgi:ketosteroid isomerase-like protein
MSRENVEALEAVYSKWGKGDFWTPEIFAPDVELAWAEELPDTPEGVQGLDAVSASMQNWLAAWDECRWTADEFLPRQERVLVLFTARGRGKGSKVDVTAHWAHLWTFRDGKATRVEGFTDQSQALEAAGLSE